MSLPVQRADGALRPTDLATLREHLERDALSVHIARRLGLEPLDYVGQILSAIDGVGSSVGSAAQPCDQ